jgi:hypothetical protein
MIGDFKEIPETDVLEFLFKIICSDGYEENHPYYKLNKEFLELRKETHKEIQNGKLR